MSFNILLESGDAILLESSGDHLELEHLGISLFTLVDAEAGEPRWLARASEPRWLAEPSSPRWTVGGHSV